MLGRSCFRPTERTPLALPRSTRNETRLCPDSMPRRSRVIDYLVLPEGLAAGCALSESSR
ncbi:hypothetical protein BDV06DRAFT_189753 [Aspergillus oleicola]